MSLTGNKDTDMELLLNTPDADLVKFCVLSAQTRQICNNESFWFRRLVKYFDLNSTKIEYFRKHYTMTFKELYRNLKLGSNAQLMLRWIEALPGYRNAGINFNDMFILLSDLEPEIAPLTMNEYGILFANLQPINN